MSGDFEHALRAWTAADGYQRTLCEWAEANGLNAEKVLEVGVRYSMKECRECTVEDSELDVVVTYENPAGHSSTTYTYDDARLVRSLSDLFADLAELMEERD